MKLLLLLAAGGSLCAQTAGVAPEWDVRSNLAAMSADVRTLQPLLDQLQPREWVNKGAPDAYVKQHQSAAASLQHLIAAGDVLAAQPDKLTVALDAFFKMEKMELLLASLKEGARRYQSPALADRLTTVVAANSVHRDRLRQHVSELAAAREQELEIIDQEAQRCRATLSREGPAPAPSGTGRTRNRQERK